MLIVIIGFLTSETLGDFWKKKYDAHIPQLWNCSKRFVFIPQDSSIFTQLARYFVSASRGWRCSVVPLLSMELDGAGTAVDLESTQAADAPNRPGCGRRCQLKGTGGFHFKCRRGAIVFGQEGLLDMLRQRETGTVDSAMQVHR